MIHRFGILLVLMILSVGCQATATSTSEMNAASPTEGGAMVALQVTSPAFSEGQLIPKKYTCDDVDVSPQLDWKGIPSNTQSLALIVDDPDAPVGTWVHWVLFNIPAAATSLPEGVKDIGTRGKNDFPNLEYGGPCPPKGPAHRYFFKLYALDSTLSLAEGAKKAEVEKAMKGHILGQGQLIGKYGR